MESSPTSGETTPRPVSPSGSITPTKSSQAKEVFNSSSPLKSPSPENHELKYLALDAASVSSSSSSNTVISTSPNDPVIIDCDNEDTNMINNGDNAPLFVLFKKLPFQVRYKIWSFNLPGPRLVEVIYDDKEEAYFTNAPIIANLSVCRESRLEALKTYPLSFACYDADEMVPFNFSKDTLFLGRKLSGTHRFFKKHVLNDDLAKVQYLMVDAYLKWDKRDDHDRGKGNLGRMSRLVFKSVKEHIVLYTKDVELLPNWADMRWFPWMHTSRIRHADPTKVVGRCKELWPLWEFRIGLSEEWAEDFRYGGIRPEEKYEPEIRFWKIPQVYCLGLPREVMETFNYSKVSCWAELLMDRVIEDIFT